MNRIGRAGTFLVLGACLLISTRAIAQTPPAEPEPPPAPPAAPAAPDATAAPPPGVSPTADAASNPATVDASTGNAELPAEIDLSAYVSDSESTAGPAIGEPSLNVYGFADFSIHSQDENSLPTALLGEAPVFFIGNLNVYLAADLTGGWKSMAEVRYSYLPDGALDRNFSRISTETSDYAAFFATKRWGAIFIERAWVEYNVHTLLTIRAGQFLTPVGIWNVDHGTPTIIPAVRPYPIGAGMFPESQTGFELYGNTLVGETTLGYHLTLSNGRGSIDKYGDLDANKAIGARAYASFSMLGTLTIGASMYTGRATMGGVVFDPTIEPPFHETILAQYDEFMYGFDLLWKFAGIHLQSEFLNQTTAFTDDGRPPPTVPYFPGSIMPDYRLWGMYVLLAYELPWLPLMPFVQFDYMEQGVSPYYTVAVNAHDVYGAGLNYRPVPTVTLKAQYYQGKMIPLMPTDETEYLRIFRFTIAWSF